MTPDFANSEVNLLMEYEGELDLSNFLSPNMDDEIVSSCTHTHTCNPPAGPDALHTHTCFHMHTKTVSSAAPLTVAETGEINSDMNKGKKKQRPLGNREAVRKYREKKKAMAASKEDEVVRLRILNQQLLQRQAILEGEIERVRCLLVDIHARIEVGIGSFGNQNKIANFPNLGGEYVQCNREFYCHNPGVEGNSGDLAAATGYQGFGCSGIENLPCMANSSSVFMEFNDCGFIGNASSTVDKQSNMAGLEF